MRSPHARVNGACAAAAYLVFYRQRAKVECFVNRECHKNSVPDNSRRFTNARTSVNCCGNKVGTKAEKIMDAYACACAHVCASESKTDGGTE